MVLPSIPSAGIQHRLDGRHGEVEEEVIVAVDELQHLDRRLRIGGLDDGRGQLAEEEGSRRAVAVVPLVAHVQRLRDDAPQIDRPRLLQRARQRRVERLLHPLQLGDDIIAVGSVAQDAPQPLVLRGVGHRPEGLVLSPD